IILSLFQTIIVILLQGVFPIMICLVITEKTLKQVASDKLIHFFMIRCDEKEEAIPFNGKQNLFISRV
ncbi:MAG: hypothetical protein K0Q87_3872, partial [Neobacillus sp.]|nr:hypothetical protein [Neobacillus sp.]